MAKKKTSNKALELPEELLAEERAERAARNKRIIKRILTIGLPSAVLLVAVTLASVLWLIPLAKYNSALDLKAEGRYLEAGERFLSLGDYKDCYRQYIECFELLYNDDGVIISGSADMPHFEIDRAGTIVLASDLDGELPSELVIPDVFDGITVSSIGSAAFAGYTEMKSLRIPPSVTSIAPDAFDGCAVEAAFIGAHHISSIPKNALRSVSITSGERIENAAFYSCKTLESVSISKSVTYVGQLAFCACPKLAEVKFDAEGRLTEIGDSAFEACTELRRVEMPEEVAAIGESAFERCIKLEGIELPKGLTVISKNIFENCYAIKSIRIPDGVTVIESFAFSGCETLSEVEIPESVVRIGEYAFATCLDLKGIKLPSSITEIEERTFYSCSSLSMIELPSGIVEIGLEAFSKCFNLGDVSLPAELSVIGACAFEGCPMISDIDLPDGVTKIGEYAFAECTALKRIIIPESVTEISHAVFEGCTMLESITVEAPNGWYMTDSLTDFENKTNGTPTDLSGTVLTVENFNEYYWYK